MPEPVPTDCLLGLSTRELEAFATRLGLPAFRGRQLAQWLYLQRARSFDDMTSLPQTLRGALSGSCVIGRSTLVTTAESTDGTRKLLLREADGARVETVVLPYEDRLSTCVSSQTGCAVACTFCATGQLGAGRNLTVGELTDQLLCATDVAGERVSHVVFMGMGEPLLNLDNVVAAIRLWRDELTLSPRHVTVSTVGLPDKIGQLARAELPVTLALSLHAANDAVRRQLIPTTAQRYSVAQLLSATRAYQAKTGRRVTYEMVLLGGLNDRPEDAELAAKRLRRGEHVNLIPFNPTRGAPFLPPSRESIAAFRTTLEEAGLVVTQRQTRGADIAGACGQLRAETKVTIGEAPAGS